MNLTTRRMLALWIVLFGAVAPAVAQADPISALIVGALGLSGGVVGAVATFAVTVGLTAAASFVANSLFGPKQASSAATAATVRQAEVTSLSIGEGPRQLIVGRAAVGGQLVDAFNWGGQYGTDWETLIIKLCDHQVSEFEGFYVNDTFVTGYIPGIQSGFNNQLSVYLMPGSMDQVMPGFVFDNSDWTAEDNLAGCAVAIVSYLADAPDATTPTWSGRPTFLWQLLGMPMYDPREDPAVGGSGSQSREDPSTWAWSENAAICHYNWQIGIYAGNQVDDLDQLLIGRGMTAWEAPPGPVFAAANLCDEVIDLGGGLSEARYRVGGLIDSSMAYVDVEQMFADAMAGQIIQPNGSVAVDPGAAKTPVATIYDTDLVSGAVEQFSGFKSDADRVNTVIPQYVEPTQKWSTTAAGVQRDPADLAEDGGPRELTLSLPIVTSRTQAERIGKIRQLGERREKSAQLVLGPRFVALEEGDWIVRSSDRSPERSATYQIAQMAQGADWRSQLTLAETAFGVYGFGGDGVDVPTPGPSTPPDALVLGHVLIELIDYIGSDGSVVQALRGHWDIPVDAAIYAIRMEIRQDGETAIASSTTGEVNLGVMVSSNGLGPNGLYQARLVPLGAQGRPIVPSAWFDFATGDLVASSTTTLGGRTADEIIASLDFNTDQITQEVLRGEAYRAYTDAILYLDGVDVGTVVKDSIDAFTVDLTATVSRLDLIGAVSGDGSAIILNGDTVMVSPTESLAEHLTSITSALDGHTAAITILESETDANSARVTISLNVDGHITALELNSDGDSGEFIIVADRFALIDPGEVGVGGGGTSSIPFKYESGIIYLDTVYAKLIKADTIIVTHLNGVVRSQSVVSFTAGTMTFDNSAEFFVCNASMTTRGGLVKVWFNAATDFSSGDAATSFTKFVLYLDGTALTQVEGPAKGLGGSTSMVWMATPSAGSHDFEVYAQVDPSGGAADYAAYNRFISAEETIV